MIEFCCDQQAVVQIFLRAREKVGQSQNEESDGQKAAGDWTERGQSSLGKATPEENGEG
jgi:hypothetical protein